MKLNVDFTRTEFEVLAKMALRFRRRTAKQRLNDDRVEFLLAEDEYEIAKALMEKIISEGEKNGVYFRAASGRDVLLDDGKSS